MVRICGLCRPKAAPKPGAELSDNRHPQPVELDGDGSQREPRNAQALTRPPTDSADPELGATSSLAEKSDVVIEIWCGAYSELQEEEAQLVEVYGTILSQQLLESVLGEFTTAAMNIFAGATVTVKIAQMKRVTQKTLEKATEHAKPHEGVGQTVNFITSLGQLVGTALQANPVAGLAVIDALPDKIVTGGQASAALYRAVSGRPGMGPLPQYRFAGPSPRTLSSG
ncbi:hypothetical protein N8I77_010903 [Diaporthe amygdali]|uniref:NWD NACHT-NTPase N-terminal domain-containing protein n=1 Tax=Phomopsis amygdali TaxID=1214568 RepID=A0AAD9S815_PHOAM|nr:hypothetical protein N8I77_010903 [Diaporthe amygdali]